MISFRSFKRKCCDEYTCHSDYGNTSVSEYDAADEDPHGILQGVKILKEFSFFLQTFINNFFFLDQDQDCTLNSNTRTAFYTPTHRIAFGSANS